MSFFSGSLPKLICSFLFHTYNQVCQKFVFSKFKILFLSFLVRSAKDAKLRNKGNAINVNRKRI